MNIKKDMFQIRILILKSTQLISIITFYSLLRKCERAFFSEHSV